MPVSSGSVVERNMATAAERDAARQAEFGRAADKAALEDVRRRQQQADAQGRPGEPLVGMTADGVPLDAEVRAGDRTPNNGA